jgi:polar amino acid transport system substrate-binding protein
MCFIKGNKNKKNVTLKITIGFDANYPPIGFLDENGKAAGFDIELANEVFKTLNLNEQIVFQPIDWDAKDLELNSGKIDCVWNGLTKTREREENMLLTKAYMKNRQIAVVNKNSAINNLNDLNGKKICLQKGSSAKESVKKNHISSLVKEIVEVENMLNCLAEVETKRCDCAVLDEFLFKYYSKNRKNDGIINKFKVLDEEIDLDCFVVAVKKENYNLKNKIEEGLSSVYWSGKAEEISKKWFDQNLFFWES